MYSIKIVNKYETIILSILVLITLTYSQSIIENKAVLQFPTHSNHYNNDYLTSNKFQMQQGFSLITSMTNNTNQTTGIYSNSSFYQLSEKIQLNTTLHLIQGKNITNFTNNLQTSKIVYDFGFKYKLGPNSLISVQLANYNTSYMFYNNFSSFNAP